MTQIAIIQVATQSMPTDTTLTKDKATHFTPHLEKAVTEAEQITSENSSSNFAAVANQPTTDTPNPETVDFLTDTQGNILTAFNIIDAANADAENMAGRDKKLPLFFDLLQRNELSFHTPGMTSETHTADQSQPEQPVRQGLTLQTFNPELVKQTADQDFAIQPAKQELTLQADSRQLSIEISGKGPLTQPTESQFHILPSGKNSADPIVQTILTPIFNTENRSVNLSPLPPSEMSATPLKIDITAAITQGKQNPNSPQVRQNHDLIQQLQQIINNGNESGTVSIQGSIKGYSLQHYSRVESHTVGMVSNQILDQGKFTEKSDTKIPTLRQDMLAQYFDAKMNTRELGDSGTNAKSSDQQNSANNQQPSTALQPNASLSTEQTSSFQHISTLMQNMQASQTQNSIRPITLPSGIVINEADVMHQVIERFQINTRARDTKISLKLYPQELGELKIDLTMREGYIKANVIVHSQQAQDIIEKNLLKLRTSIENQGFSVEEITVTSESDSVPEFDLFEQHLSQQKDLSPTVAITRDQNNFDEALEDAVEQSTGLSTGVNIKV